MPTTLPVVDHILGMLCVETLLLTDEHGIVKCELVWQEVEQTSRTALAESDVAVGLTNQVAKQGHLQFLWKVLYE